MFLAIPAIGAWQYGKVYSQNTAARQISVAQIHATPPKRIEQCKLVEFEVLGEPIKSFGREYVFVQERGAAAAVASSARADCLPEEMLDLIGLQDNREIFVPKIVLRREARLDGKLADRIADGEINGMISSNLNISWERANEMGLAVDELDPDSYRIIDVDRHYFEQQLSNVFWATVYLSSAGFLLMCYLLTRIRNSQMQDSIRRNRTRAQLALQISIANQ